MFFLGCPSIHASCVHASMCPCIRSARTGVGGRGVLADGTQAAPNVAFGGFNHPILFILQLTTLILFFLGATTQIVFFIF